MADTADVLNDVAVRCQRRPQIFRIVEIPAHDDIVLAAFLSASDEAVDIVPGFGNDARQITDDADLVLLLWFCFICTLGCILIR